MPTKTATQTRNRFQAKIAKIRNMQLNLEKKSEHWLYLKVLISKFLQFCQILSTLYTKEFKCINVNNRKFVQQENKT